MDPKISPTLNLNKVFIQLIRYEINNTYLKDNYFIFNVTMENTKL